MHAYPFRTGNTWLADEQLVLLDVLFRGRTPYELLREEGFHNQWNLGYSHGLDDDLLCCHLRWLCEHGVLKADRANDRTVFRMTEVGGALWSQERCPDWERYCTEKYKTTSQDRTLMTVMAVSPQVRDEFLALWPPGSARRRSVTIADFGLIEWHPFWQLYVGVATYEEQRQFTAAEYTIWLERDRKQQATLDRNRSWWRCVPELQRFVPKTAEPGGPVNRPRETR